MKNYERDQRTGQITLSDGNKKQGKDQIKFHRCEWKKNVNKKTKKLNHYKMTLPANLFGISTGAYIKFSDRYIIK